MSTTYRLHGINDEASECSLCGRNGLKKVAWLSELDADGNEITEAGAYGTDCAGQLLTGRKTSKATREIVKAAELVARLRDQLGRSAVVLAGLEADGGIARATRLLEVASLRREAGHTVEQVAAELLADSRANVAKLTAELTAAEILEAV